MNPCGAFGTRCPFMMISQRNMITVYIRVNENGVANKSYYVEY